MSVLRLIILKPPSSYSPGYLPEHTNKLFLEATDNLRRKNYDSCSMICRKILDISTKQLDSTINGSLKSRIDKLASNHLITPDLKEWAHEIRDIGNETSHEDKLTEEKDAQDIYNFTDLFLQYVFTLPGMLKERKSSDTEE